MHEKSTAFSLLYAGDVSPGSDKKLPGSQNNVEEMIIG